MSKVSKDSRVLILCNTNVFPSYLFQNRGVDFYSFFSDELNLFFKSVRRISFAMPFVPVKFWYDKWYKQISRYKLVIIFAINGIDSVIRDIENRISDDAKVIIFFWDPVFRVHQCLKYNFQKWSFDQLDCIKYTMQYNSTFYFKDILKYTYQSDLIEDPTDGIYFTGLIKGRDSYIQNLTNQLKKDNISFNFILVDGRVHKRVSFKQNLINIQRASALLDIVQNGQSGLTVRVMESLFWNKKLVTNNAQIKNETFYHPSRVFILGEDDMASLSSFMKAPISSSLNDGDLLYYDFDSWLKRFSLND